MIARSRECGSRSFSAHVRRGALVLLASVVVGWGMARPPAALFEDVAEKTGLQFHHFIGATGSYFVPEIFGSGIAVLDYDGDGDLDNDGDIDIAVSNANGPARLLLNQVGNRNHWLEIRLQGVTVNRDAYGARLALFRKGRPPMWRRAAADGSYLSASDPRVHFGLGSDDDMRTAPLESLLVIWPNGAKEKWDVAKPDCLIHLREGSGSQVTTSAIPASKP